MLCFRKKRKQNMSFHNPNYKNPVSTEEKTFPYEESRYEKIDMARAYSTVEKTSTTHIYAKPMKPLEPAESEGTKLTHSYCYILDTHQGVTNPILDTNTATELNVYDDVVNPPMTPRKLPESVYCEAFDYSKQDTDNGSYVSMCVPTYGDPAPLTTSEAPKLIEWEQIKPTSRIRK